jgi:hypothetical protein
MSYRRDYRGPLQDVGSQYDITKSSDNDHIYYSLTINNSSDDFALATFTDNRNDYILQNPQAFHFSVIQFTIDGMGIPIFIWPIVAGTTNVPDNTFFTVSLSLLGNAPRTAPLIYTNFSSLPNTPDNLPWIFSYQHMVDIINAAYITAYNALVVQVTAPVLAALGITMAPYMTYSTITGQFTMNFQAGYAFDPTVPSTTVRVFMNGRLYGFFDNFETLFNGYTAGGNDNPLAFQFIVKNDGNNRIILDYPGSVTMSTDPGWAMRQETNTLSLWNDAASIVFTSGLIPVNQELLTPANVGWGQAPVSTNQFKNILIEFDIFADDTVSNPTRSIIQYIPTGEYRLVDLKTNTPIRALDIQVFWKSRDQTYYPLAVPPHSSFQMKMMFRKKENCKEGGLGYK